MGFPLALDLAEIFMVELERSLVPKLSNYIKFWKRFADDMSHLQILKLLIIF